MVTVLSSTIDRKNNLFRFSTFISCNIWISFNKYRDYFFFTHSVSTTSFASILQAKIENIFLGLEQTEDGSNEEGSKGIWLLHISQVRCLLGSMNKI